MLSRRSFIAAGLCSCSTLAGCVPSSDISDYAGADGDAVPTSGCMVSVADLRRDQFDRLGTSFAPASSAVYGNKNFRISNSSGNRVFDRALVESLAFMSQTFEVLPTFGFINGSGFANAFATPKPFEAAPGDAPLPRREHGSVMLGDGMLPLLAAKGIDNPVAAALAICAHEFGHIVQYNVAYKGKRLVALLQGDLPTVKRVELHADFLSGYYVGTAKRRNPETPAATIAAATYAIGDFNVNDRGHHGTPKERGAAIYAGYREGFEVQASRNAAIVSGLKFVGAI